MSMSDPLGDMLSRIRNSQMRQKERVRIPASRLHRNVLEVLRREGYKCRSRAARRASWRSP